LRHILALNYGSSSLKFKLIDVSTEGARPVAQGGVERLAPGELGIESVVRTLSERGFSVDTVDAVGHRVVHGGTLGAPARIDDEVISAIERASALAPLHNVAALRGIREARAAFGRDTPMVAVFDTAFHQTMPEHAALYALPLALSRRHGIRRFGFHGISHRYVALRYAEITGQSPDAVTLVTLHLGNGCSATAIRRGQSVDTSMGFTPLEGLMMGTRSGDLDPALVGYLQAREDKPLAEINRLLNHESGLLGVSGLSHDMRQLLHAEAAGDEQAHLALEMFCYRVRKYVGAYLAVLGGAQAIVFTGGMGERAAPIRARIGQGFEWAGLAMDDRRNDDTVGREGQISAEHGRLQAYVIPTDEELMIARETAACISRGGDSSRRRSR
jgi:acetate kinase